MAKKKDAPKQIAELGEFGLINRLSENVKISHKSTVKGIGDDAAVLKTGSKLTVVTTDLLLEGIHFNLMYMPLKHLGYKAVIVNLSDVYAMNAKPEQITVSIGISSRFDAEDVEEIYEGIKLACEIYNVDLVGGDTSASMTGLTLSITAIGTVNEKEILYRSGAQENDLICVSGNLGGAYIGLQVLEREKEIFSKNSGIQPDLSGYEYVLERQLKPEARKDIIDFFIKEKIRPTAMIDISDGLSSDLMHICDASNKGCKIFSDKIPVDADTASAAEEMNLEPITCALHGGEDYELLFTVPLSDFEKLKEVQAISIIGHITASGEGRYLILPDGSAIEIAAKGWDGLKQQGK
ncbi:MAG: thiamine-phosphate kinase [Bacteroidales bacterium]|nr:thiamine-phosphate kinase [Bacteroidales bacterium]